MINLPEFCANWLKNPCLLLLRLPLLLLHDLIFCP